MSEPLREPERLRLESVTLCAVSSSNIKATVKAMEASLAQVRFADAILLTHQDAGSMGLDDTSPIRVIRIDPIRSSSSYSRFLLEELPDHISTNHCLIVQWDGHVIDAGRWKDEFLDYDYIGASWPQFDDGYEVGNGGFSLRSRRLMEACRKSLFQAHHPEDVAIGRTNRALLESLGLRFAPVELADQFSAERASDPTKTFGYHGVFLMPDAIGIDRFWEIYLDLDDLSTTRDDWLSLLKAIGGGKNSLWRSITFLACCGSSIILKGLATLARRSINPFKTSTPRGSD